MQAVEFKQALRCEKVGVLDIGAGSGLLTMMAARYLLHLYCCVCCFLFTFDALPETQEWGAQDTIHTLLAAQCGALQTVCNVADYHTIKSKFMTHS